MENNRIEKRINIIKENLRKESCGVLLADMTAKQKTQLCSVFNVSENEIVGYYEDIMNLGKTLLAFSQLFVTINFFRFLSLKEECTTIVITVL